MSKKQSNFIKISVHYVQKNSDTLAKDINYLNEKLMLTLNPNVVFWKRLSLWTSRSREATHMVNDVKWEKKKKENYDYLTNVLMGSQYNLL